MIKRLLTASVISLGAMLLVSPVHAIGLTYNWSFNSNGNSATATGLVTGTITGLQIGSNNGSGITATVTGTPTGDLVGTVFNTFVNSALNGDAFTVDAGGNVTLADASYISAGNDYLYFGGFGGYVPQLRDSTSSVDFYTENSPTTFTPAATAVPFEFAPNGAVILLGGLWGAKKLRKKLSKKAS